MFLVETVFVVNLQLPVSCFQKTRTVEFIQIPANSGWQCVAELELGYTVCVLVARAGLCFMRLSI